MLPQYHIERLLGHGGMGAVYQGEQTALRRKVALKLLPADLAMDAMFVARFQREARMLARLQHPGIVAVYDCGQSSAGHLYFVMEYVEGTDLQRVLRDPGLEPEQAMELITQICDALHYAHRQGVIHRDIKPANILLGVDGRVKVADFGLARPNEIEGDELTKTNMVMGTPAYMAPEQRMGHADARADIFALGVMLYEMLTGKRPQGAFDPPSHKVHVDVRIDRVVLKALQAEPERRYQQVSEMRSDVEDIRTTPLPVEAPAPALPRKRRRWKWALALGMVVVLSGLALNHFYPEKFSLEFLKGAFIPAATVAPGTLARATPPAVPEADRLALQAALFGSDWLYSIGVGAVNSHELRFEQDHNVRTNRGKGAIWHWWIVGARSVHLQFANEPEQYDPERGTNLTFDPSLKKFHGLAVNGRRRQSGEQIPKERALNAQATPTPKPIAAATPAPPTPVRATPTPIAVSTPKPATPAPSPPWPAPGNQMSDVSGMKQLAAFEFARGLHGFPRTDDKKWKLGLVDGEYQMLCRDDGLWWSGHPLQKFHVNDFVCEITARILPNADGGWGLGMIGVAGGEDHPWTGVMVDGAGTINTHSYDIGPDLPPQSSPAMRRGAEANTIRIEAIGDRLRIFANGVFVCERTHRRLRPISELTLYRYGKAGTVDVRVSRVRVWEPTTASTPAPVGAKK